MAARRLALWCCCAAWLALGCRGPELGDDDQTGEQGTGDSGTTDEPEPFVCEPWPDGPRARGHGSAMLAFTDASAELGLVDTAFFPGDWPPYCDTDGQGWVAAPCKMFLQSAGAAVGDFDEDGWPDIYLTRLVGRGLLYRNQLGEGGEPAFVELGLERGLVDEFNGSGAAWVDIDGDRDLDLYVTTMDNPGRFWLFVNQLRETGVAEFDEDAEARGLALADGRVHYGFSIGVGDYDGDSWLDLYTSEWLPGVDSDERVHARLLRNLGAIAPGVYEDRTLAANASMRMINPEGVYLFSPAFVDLDEDGLQDLALVSDNGTSRLYWNRGDGSFIDGTPQAGVSLERNGMGSTFGDVDGDGHLDWFVTAIFSPDDAVECGNPVCGRGGNRLYRSIGPRCFEELAEGYGLNIGGWGWGTSFWDPDNDGDLDIVEINGFTTPHGPPGLYFTDDPMRLWLNRSELGELAFDEQSAAAGLFDVGQGRGLLAFDYDRDGDEDLLTVDLGGINGGSTKLWRNELGNQHAWLAVELDGRGGNRYGVGARIELRSEVDGPALVRVIGAASHFLGHAEYRAHFGLGPEPATITELRVRWPSGATTVLENIDARQTLHIAEPP